MHVLVGLSYAQYLKPSSNHHLMKFRNKANLGFCRMLTGALLTVSKSLPHELGFFFGPIILLL